MKQKLQEICRSNLRFKYEPGIYTCCFCLYEPEYRYPRRLAAEQSWFCETAELEIGREKSSFHLRLRKDTDRRFWCFTEQGWREAVRKEQMFILPADVFRFQFFLNEPIGEGECLTAWTGPGETAEKIEKENCRELNVHIW